MKSFIKNFWYTWGGWFITIWGYAIANVIFGSDIRFTELLAFVSWIGCGVAYKMWLSSYRTFSIISSIEGIVKTLNAYNKAMACEEKKWHILIQE